MSNTNTKIRFWSGLKTIGGTIVSVQHENSRIIFDFGLSYNPAEEFSSIVKIRYHALVEDYINLNKIPPIDGIYSKDALGNLNNIIPSEEDERNTAVIISHIHLDHIGAMGLISPDIPVYLTEESLKLYENLKEIGEGVFGERNYNSITYEEVLKIGDIKVTAVLLDHDVLGACGFFIETPDVKIVYSGDLRLHGKHPELTMNFISKANKFEPNVLMMEGTMINGEKESKDTKPSPELTGINTEQQVKELFINKFEKSKGLVLINASERNLERIADIIDAAKIADRKIVLEPETAYLILKIINNNDFIIYKSEELETGLLYETAQSWMGAFIESHETIGYREINLNPEKYVLQNSFRNLMEVMDLNLKKSVYIHSNAVPLGAYDPDYLKLQEFLRRLKIDYEYIGTPGHAFHSHLKYIIDEIQPEILVPLHSFYPEKLYPESKIQFLPKYDMEYIVKDKKMIKLTIKH
jgi:ribonuclease J